MPLSETDGAQHPIDAIVTIPRRAQQQHAAERDWIEAGVAKRRGQLGARDQELNR